MSAIGSIGNSSNVQQQTIAQQSQPRSTSTNKSAEEKAETPAQEAAEKAAGGLDVDG